MHDEGFRVIQDDFKHAIDEGFIKDIDPYYLTVGIHSLMHSFLYEFCERRGEHTLKEVIDIAKMIFFESVVTEKGKFEISKK